MKSPHSNPEGKKFYLRTTHLLPPDSTFPLQWPFFGPLLLLHFFPIKGTILPTLLLGKT